MAASPTSRVCICQSRQEVETLIKDFEERTQCKYVSVCNDKNFNDMEWQPSGKNRVFFEKKNDGKSPTISFTGMPFIFIGSMSYECHLGKDRAKKKKERYAQKNICEEKKRRFLAQDTKKIGCPAELKVTRVAMFPEHKIIKDSVWERKRAGQALRIVLQENKLVAWENTYYVLVPQPEDHVGHPILGEVQYFQEAANPVVEEKIKELLKQGVKSVSEMRRHIREFVKSNLYSGDKPLPLTRYRYYTLHQNLRNIMKNARDAALHSRDEQEKLEILAQIWKHKDPDDNIFVRPHHKGNVILCYQTKWQQRLLNLYGQDVCLLDATYKVMGDQLPLFFVWVRTNVCYVAVAVFIVHHETEEAVSDALQVLKAWNEGWSPGHFMVDFSTAQITALESVFTNCKAILCDFHRDKAWDEWVRKADHEVQNQDEALASLRIVAAAGTPMKYEQALKELQNSEEWSRNPLFQKWFQTTWLPEKKRWATVFREESLQLNIITNNGTERLNETFKYTLLEKSKNSTMSEVMAVIVNNFIPQLQKKYTQVNIQYSSGSSASIPLFLYNRPSDMVMHIKDRLAASLGPEHITEMSLGTFKVTSEEEKESCVVTLGSSSTLPSCTCEDWKRYKLPCKHFCTGFKAGWTWDDLCPQYKNSPLFTLDPFCFSSSSLVSQLEDEQAGDDNQADEDLSDGEGHEAMFEGDNKNPDDQGNELLPQDELGPLQELLATTETEEIVSTARQQCIELLRVISDAIFFVDNNDFLQNLQSTLEDVAVEVKEHTPHDKQMALNNITKRKSTGIHDAVPPPKRAKYFFANRPGVSAKIEQSNMKVSKDGTTPVPINSPLSVDHSDSAHLHDQLPTNVDELKLEMPERPMSETWCSVGGIVLTMADENVLRTGQWLNDKLVNASQILLREEFPFVEGLSNTVLLPAATLQDPTASDVVQIHHVGRHWLVSTLVRGQVHVYDSLLTKSCISPALREQLATVYRSYSKGPDGIIDVQIKCTQKQQQEEDCGLFAIANAFSLTSGIDPAKIQYNQNLMRTHLHTCLTKGNLKMFPHTQRRSRWIIEKCEILSKYCICHQHRENSNMVMCNTCKAWYHCSCVNISANTVQQVMTNGYCCPRCS